MTYFVVSDIHSFAQELIDALNDAGFDIRNPNHILISLGDIFDRGSEALRVYKFLKSIPKYRRILVKGNHTDLYLELLNQDYPSGRDFHNHTVDTFCQIAGKPTITINDEEYKTEQWLKDGYYYYSGTYFDREEIAPECKKFWQEEILPVVQAHEITKWIQSKEWKDYFELGKYIFVHSFIPVKIKEGFEGVKWYDLKPKVTEYDPDWRESSAFYEARWGCPYAYFRAGHFNEEIKKGKVLVCGHWFTGDFYAELAHDYRFMDCPAPIYYDEHLIALDGGCFQKMNYVTLKTFLIHPQNVLIIREDGKCCDRFQDELKFIEKMPYRETVTIEEAENLATENSE